MASSCGIFFITWRLHTPPESFAEFFQTRFLRNPEGYTIISANPDLNTVAVAFASKLGIQIASTQRADVRLLWEQRATQKTIAFVSHQDFEVLATVMPIDPSAIVIGISERGQVKCTYNDYNNWNLFRKPETLPNPRLPVTSYTPYLDKRAQSDDRIRLEPPSPPDPQQFLLEGISGYAKSMYKQYEQKISDLQKRYQGRRTSESAQLQAASNQQEESIKFLYETQKQLFGEGSVVPRLQAELTALEATLAQLQARVKDMSLLMPVEVQLVKARYCEDDSIFLAFRLLDSTTVRCVKLANVATVPDCVYLGSDFTLVHLWIDMPQNFDFTIRFIDSDTQKELAEPLRLTATEFFSSRFHAVEIDDATNEKYVSEQNEMKVRYEQSRKQPRDPANRLVPQISS